MNDFKKARGVVPHKEGDALPEDYIQGARGNFEPLYRHFRKRCEKLETKLTHYEAVRKAADEYVNIALEIDDLNTSGRAMETPALKQKRAIKMQALVSALIWFDAHKRTALEASGE